MVKRFNKETGAQLIEYAMGAAILLAVFIVVGFVIESSGKKRGDASMSIHEESVPCGADLSGDECL